MPAGDEIGLAHALDGVDGSGVALLCESDLGERPTPEYAERLEIFWGQPAPLSSETAALSRWAAWLARAN